MNRPILLTLLGWIAVFGASAASALTVTGTIRDAANQPIPGIRVEVYHLGAAADLREAVFADATGVYSSNLVQSGDNVYILARWDFALQPAAAVGGHVVSVVARGAGDPFVATTTYLLKLSPTVPNVTNNLVIDLKMDQVQPAGLANVPLRASQVLTYIESNRGGVPWSLTVDIPIFLITDDKDRMTPTEIYIGHQAFDGTGTAFDIVTAYHELGHWIHHHHNGPGGLPGSEPGCGTHTINSEEGPICALVEAYPSYLGQLVAEANGVMSPFYRGYRDDGVNTVNALANTLWRGDESTPTGRDNGTWESGVGVEGAVAGFLFEVHNAHGFQTVFEAFITKTPQDALGVLVGISDKFGPGAPLTLAVNAFSQQHGLVYSRGRFAPTPFAASQPPNGLPASTGNFKAINGFSFLRGLVPTVFQAVPGADLGVGTPLASKSVRLGKRPATPGVLDPPNFQPATASVPVAAATVDLDTRTLGPASGDGDWDLAVLYQNLYDFEDNFLPGWLSDGDFDVSSDEMYLKTLGTWYDPDRNPITDTDAGMVVVDNTAPTVSNFKP